MSFERNVTNGKERGGDGGCGIPTIDEWLDECVESTNMSRYEGNGKKTLKRPPKEINGHLFGDRIGIGSFGRVRECYSLETMEKRAVKIFRAPKANRLYKPNVSVHAKNEIFILAKCSHENIVKLFSTFRNEETQKLYLFIEFGGTDLMHIIDSLLPVLMNERIVKVIIRQLLEAVDYLHSIYIVHGDIKPGNLLIDKKFHLKLCDFGSAEIFSVFDKNPILSAAMGSPAYEPPEVGEKDEKEIKAFKVCSWQCGISTYQIIMGKLPFKCHNYLSVQAAISKCSFDIPRHLSNNLQHFLSSLMNRNLEKRSTIQEAKKHIWLSPEPNEDEIEIDIKTITNHTTTIATTVTIRHESDDRIASRSIGPSVDETPNDIIANTTTTFNQMNLSETDGEDDDDDDDDSKSESTLTFTTKEILEKISDIFKNYLRKLSTLEELLENCCKEHSYDSDNSIIIRHIPLDDGEEDYMDDMGSKPIYF